MDIFAKVIKIFKSRHVIPNDRRAEESPSSITEASVEDAGDSSSLRSVGMTARHKKGCSSLKMHEV